MNQFDAKGDLWIEVKMENFPQQHHHGLITALAPGPYPGSYMAVTAFNLSEYIRTLINE